MTRRQRLAAVLVALCVVTPAFAGTALAATDGSIAADPGDPGTTATHTVTVTVGDASAGAWTGLSIDYGDSGASAADVARSYIERIGVDEDDDGAGDTIDREVGMSVESVATSANGTTLTVALDGSTTIDAGDELVLVYGNATNPMAGEWTVGLEVNPMDDGGETTATLATGSMDDGSMGDDDGMGGNESMTSDESMSGEDSMSGNDTMSGDESMSGEDSMSGNDSMSGDESMSGEDSMSGNESMTTDDGMNGNESMTTDDGMNGNESTSSGDESMDGEDSMSGNETMTENESMTASPTDGSQATSTTSGGDDADSTAGSEAAEGGDGPTETGGQPGLGLVAAVVGLLAAAGLLIRRQG